MDSFAIRQRVNFINEKLKKNAETFVLDDSAALIEERKNLQNECTHIREDGTFAFDLEDCYVCPICDFKRRGIRRTIGLYEEAAMLDEE